MATSATNTDTFPASRLAGLLGSLRAAFETDQVDLTPFRCPVNLIEERTLNVHLPESESYEVASIRERCERQIQEREALSRTRIAYAGLWVPGGKTHVWLGSCAQA